MPNKICYLLLLVVFCWTSGVAQQDRIPGEISWGPDITEPSRSSITKVVEVSSNDYYVLRERQPSAIARGEVFIEQYDNQQRLKRSVELPLKYKQKWRSFEDLVKIGNNFYFFTSFNNEAQKKNYLFYQKLNSKLQPERNLSKIAEIPAANRARTGAFNLLLSQDSSKVLLYSQLDNKRKEPERFAIRVFDNQMQELWSKNIRLPYSEQQFSVEDYRVDKDGNVYLLCIQYLDDSSQAVRRGLANYQYVILSYTDNGERKQEYRLAVKDKFITDMTFRIGNEGDLICAGFFSERGTNSIKGTCFFRVNPETEEVFNVSLQEFDFEFRTAFMRGSQQRRAERAEQSGNTNQEAELSRFALNDLILRSDGGAVIVAEQFFVFQRTYRLWDGTLQFDEFYNYNDIIVVNIRPDGSMEWSVRIPKRQETVNDGGYYSSYSMAVVRDRLYFIFNDNSRNYTSQNDNNLYNFNGRNSIITLAEIRKGGELEMYPLFNNRDAGIITRPKICKQTGSRKMIVYGERGRSYRLGLLQFL
ncbi:MAG: hypothetical protein KI786_09465 [Mameliella sp.]|nr:hypothetical protein [Phaeodactylibacter sp.]